MARRFLLVLVILYLGGLLSLAVAVVRPGDDLANLRMVGSWVFYFLTPVTIVIIAAYGAREWRLEQRRPHKRLSPFALAALIFCGAAVCVRTLPRLYVLVHPLIGNALAGCSLLCVATSTLYSRIKKTTRTLGVPWRMVLLTVNAFFFILYGAFVVPLLIVLYHERQPRRGSRGKMGNV
jgi:hypothetical protein